MRVQLPNGDWVTFPDEMSQEDVTAALQQISPPGERYQEPVDDETIARRALRQANPMLAFGDAALNAPESVAGVAKGFYNAVRHPVETAKAADELITSGVRKIDRLMNKNIAGIVTDPEGEEVADAFIQDQKNRYGSGEALLNTFAEDPAGMALDTAGLLTPLGKAKYLDPYGAGGRVVQRGAGKTANPLYRHATGIEPSTLDKGEDLARRGMRDNVVSSRSGLKGIAKTKEELNAQLNQMMTDSMEGVELLPKSVIVDNFDGLIERYRGTPDGTKSISHLKKKRQEFLDEFPGRDELYPYELHDWKTSAYETAYDKKARGKASRKVQAYRQSARGANDALQDTIEGYTPVNQKWKTQAEMEAYISNRVDNLAKQDSTFQKMVNLTINNPGWQSRLAIGLQHFADGNMGWLEKNLNTAEIRTVLALAGMEEMEQQ